MAYKVMLSYSWDNSAERAALVHQLGMIRGVSVLFDRKHVGIGAAVHRELSGLLSKADCIVALLTKTAVRSKEVLDELTRAHERGKHIVPIVATDVSTDSLPWFLREANFIRYSLRDFDSTLAAVESAVRDAANKSQRRKRGRNVSPPGKVTRVAATLDVKRSPFSDPKLAKGARAPAVARRPKQKTGSATPDVGTYFRIRDSSLRSAKRSVALCIVENYLRDGDSILLDAGSSMYPIAESIAENTRAQPERCHFTIMTHNCAALEILTRLPSDSNINVVSAGGRYDRDLNAFLGPQTVNAYADFFPRVVILGVSGVRAEVGLFCHGNTEEVGVKTFIFRKQVRDRIIVADHTKLGFQDGFRFGESNALRDGTQRCIVVTSSPPRDASPDQRELFEGQVKLLKQYGVHVVVMDAAYQE